MRKLLFLFLLFGLPCYGMSVSEFETLYDNIQHGVINKYDVEPNNEYQIKVICDSECSILEPNYSTFLKDVPNKQWKQYLEIRFLQQKYSNGYTYQVGYNVVTMDSIQQLDLLKRQKQFIKKNKEFSHIQEAKDLYKIYFMSLFNNGMNFTYDGHITDFKVTPEYINLLEMYLKEFPKDKDYEIVLDWYNTLKDNDFYCTEDVYLKLREVEQLLEGY